MLSKTVETKKQKKKQLYPKSKTHLLKQSIFVSTKYETEDKRPIRQQYFLTFVMLERFDTYRHSNSNTVFGLDLRMNNDRGVK